MIKLILLILAGLVLVLGGAAACYVYNNLNYDKGTEKNLKKAGFVEKQAVLADGTALNYGEGPENGPPLLLIHGQMTTWKNYVRILPELAQGFSYFCRGLPWSWENSFGRDERRRCAKSPPIDCRQ